MTEQKDLLEVINEAYQEWTREGTCEVAGEKLSIKPKHETPASAQAGFIDFCRAYLRANPIVSTNFTMGVFAVYLKDGRQFPVVVPEGGFFVMRDEGIQMGRPHSANLPGSGSLPF